MNYSKLSIKKLRELLTSGKLSSMELVDFFIKKIETEDDKIDSVLEIFSDARNLARKADERIKSGEQSSLLGIPFIIKDNILYKDHKASAASKMLENYTAPYSATVVSKLLEFGAIPIARANMDEFAMGSSTETSAFKITKNPHDLLRVPGGSSGGSAASVSAGFAPFALGTDTGGSIRQPASFCGVVGFKPSYGAVSRFGLIAMGSSLDQAGPLTKSVEDAEIVFKAIYGQDKNDATSVPDKFLKGKKEFKKIGVPRKFLQKGVDDMVLNVFADFEKKLEKAGFEIVDIELDAFEYALPSYYIIMPAEVSTNLARFDGLRYGTQIEGEDYKESFAKTRGALFGDEVKRRILLGTFVLSSGYMDAFYYKAQSARKFIKESLNKVFESVDVILTPTSPSPAFKIGEKISDPLQMYMADIFTVPVNITETPAISLPIVKQGQLPVGMQFIARKYDDFSLLEFAKKAEKVIQTLKS